MMSYYLIIRQTKGGLLSYFVHSSHTDAAQVQRVNSLQLHSFLKEASLHVDEPGLQMTADGFPSQISAKLEQYF